MKTSDFYYDLPKELIAQDPLEDRSSSRLLCLDRVSGAIRHDSFKNIVSHLRSGDVLVLNDTKVIPARLYGARKESGGKVEILLLNRLTDTDWECLVKPGKKCRKISLNFGLLGKISDFTLFESISKNNFSTVELL